MYPEELTKKAEELVAKLAENSWHITMAESCTGGLLGGLITSVSGSSDVFKQGFITYSNEAKSSMIGVDEELLMAHGAVSEEVAYAMAQGAFKTAEADIALSITGIAGPGGGTDAKPVGLVYIGCVLNKNNVQISSVNRHVFSGDRQEVRLQACEQAIQLALINCDA